MSTPQSKRAARIDQAVAEWGAANRSDPFAAARARTHYRVGIAGVDACDYETRELSETHQNPVTGEEYTRRYRTSHGQP